MPKAMVLITVEGGVADSLTVGDVATYLVDWDLMKEGELREKRAMLKDMPREFAEQWPVVVAGMEEEIEKHVRLDKFWAERGPKRVV